MAQYNIYGVRGLESYLHVLRNVLKEGNDVSKIKYYHKQGAVDIITGTEMDVSGLAEKLKEKGLVLKLVKAF